MNQITILGNLGKDPEHQTINEKSLAKFPVAVNRKYQDKQITTWFNIVAWGKVGEVICQYFNKGDQILLTGRLDIKDYEDSNGNSKKWVEIFLKEFHFVGSKDEGKNKTNKTNQTTVKGNKNLVAGGDIKTNENFTSENIPF